jgi:hypothetical protein
MESAARFTSEQQRALEATLLGLMLGLMLAALARRRT